MEKRGISDTLGKYLKIRHANHLTTVYYGMEESPLAEGADFWKKVLQKAPDTYALMEFVREDDQRALMEDAAALRRWIGEEVWNLPTC